MFLSVQPSDNYVVRLLHTTPCNYFEANLRYHIISYINILVHSPKNKDSLKNITKITLSHLKK